MRYISTWYLSCLVKARPYLKTPHSQNWNVYVRSKGPELFTLDLRWQSDKTGLAMEKYSHRRWHRPVGFYILDASFDLKVTLFKVAPYNRRIKQTCLALLRFKTKASVSRRLPILGWPISIVHFVFNSTLACTQPMRRSVIGLWKYWVCLKSPLE